MSREMGTCLAVIPARGGSKRIPKKNVRASAGSLSSPTRSRPLCKAVVFERVVVTH